jgi:hypothetical protein
MYYALRVIPLYCTEHNRNIVLFKHVTDIVCVCVCECVCECVCMVVCVCVCVKVWVSVCMVV